MVAARKGISLYAGLGDEARGPLLDLGASAAYAAAPDVQNYVALGESGSRI